MKVTYIHHSSFLVETDENYFYLTILKENFRNLRKTSLFWFLPAIGMEIIFHR